MIAGTANAVQTVDFTNVLKNNVATTTPVFVVPGDVIKFDATLVQNGATGVTSGLDLGVYLLERELGPRITHAVEALFAYERRGTVWRAHGPEPLAP